MELKPCPFCGSEEVKFGYLSLRAFVLCKSCHAKTDCYAWISQATEAWNRGECFPKCETEITEDTKAPAKSGQISDNGTEADKQARWETEHSVLGKRFVCSRCKGTPALPYDYCPYCGEKMLNKGAGDER